LNKYLTSYDLIFIVDDSDLLDDVTSSLAINNIKRNYGNNSKALNSEKSIKNIFKKYLKYTLLKLNFK
jgi:hypothetical protein